MAQTAPFEALDTNKTDDGDLDTTKAEVTRQCAIPRGALSRAEISIAAYYMHLGGGHTMDESLEKGLLDMEARDQELRAELTAAGELNQRYHPRLEELHRANASRLRQIIAVFGWPGAALVGEKGARAAWRIALHSIAEPPFMRHCRDLIDAASQRQDAPRWQFAIIDDRIRVYEGKAQRYGTQLRVGENGLEPQPLENEARINSMRMQAGLPPMAQTLAKARSQPQITAAEQAKRDAAEFEFRRLVGWIT